MKTIIYLKSKNSIILLVSLLFVLASCSKDSKSELKWKLNFGEIVLSSSDEIKVGLNKAEFSNSIKENEFHLNSDMGEVAFEIRDKSLWFAIEKGTEVEFSYSNEVHKMAIADKQKINVKNDSVWIAAYEPMIAEYGRQPMAFLVFRKSKGKWSKSYEDIDFMPWMNMGNGYGHGSQYNVSPIIIDTLGGRLYRGIISFSMPGNWDVRFITFNDTLATTIPVSAKQD
jgi:hypothetical protein